MSKSAASIQEIGEAVPARRLGTKRTASSAITAAPDAPLPMKRKTGAARTKAIVEDVVADEAPEVAAEVPAAPAAPKKKRAPPKNKKVAAEAADAKEQDDNEEDGEVAGGSAAAAAPKKPRAPKAPKAKIVFLQAYGDLGEDDKARKYEKEDFEEWKAKTQYCLDNITYSGWKSLKKAFYKQLKDQRKKKVKSTKKKDCTETTANHLKRLKEMPKDEFAALNGTWLSAYGFDNSYTAEQLDAAGGFDSDEGALSAYAVYQAAKFHGFAPLGIVSAKSKQEAGSKELKYITDVDGPRVYVGAALPFKGILKSTFGPIPTDRVFVQAADDAAAE